MMRTKECDADLDAFNQQRKNNFLLNFIYTLNDPFCVFQVCLRSRPLWDITDGLPAQMPLWGFISTPLLPLTTERATVWGTSEYSSLLSRSDFISFTNQVNLIHVKIRNAKRLKDFLPPYCQPNNDPGWICSVLRCSHNIHCFLMHYINNH